MARNGKTGQVEIDFQYSRHLGPRFIQGAVTLQFDSLQPYKFTSTANWPTSANYDEVIRIVVEETLIEIQGHLHSPSVLLKNIKWNEIASCESGFQRAARIATLAAFDV